MALSATFAADFKSFTDACAKAEVSLKGIETGAGNVETKLDRMSNSLSGTKIIQQASIMAEAVERVGGVSTLTEKELAKVGSTASEASEKLVAMGQKVPPGIQKIADAAEQARKKSQDFGSQVQANFSSLGSEIQKTAIGMATGLITVDALREGFGRLTDFVESSVHSYLEAERVQRQLTAALQAQGTAVPAVIDQYEALSKEFEQTTVNSDEAVKGVEQLLVQVGNVMPSQMHKAIQATADLSAGLGIDLKQAALLVAKASEENTTALRKAGVQLDDTRVKGEGLEYVLGQVEKRFGGQALAEISSYEGQIKRLGNQWDDFKESIGSVVVKTGALQVAMALAAGEITRTQSLLAHFGLGEAPKVLTTDQLAAQKKAADEAEAAARKQADADKAATDAAKAHADALKKAQEAAKAYNDEIAKTAAKYSGAALAEDVRKFADVLKRLGDVANLSGLAQRQLAKDLYELQQRGAVLTPQMLEVTATYLRFSDAGVKVEQGVANLTKALPNLFTEWQMQAEAAAKAEAAYDKLLSNRTFVTPAQIRNLPQVILKQEDQAVIVRDLQSPFTEALGKAANEFPGMLGQAIIHGQSITQAFDAIFMQIGGDFGQIFGKGLASAGSKVGGLLGNIFGPLGAIGGDLLGKAFDKIFGNEGKKVNDLRDQFIASQGGLAALQKQIAETGNDPQLVAAFNKLYNTGKVQEFQAAVQQLIAREAELGQQRQDQANAETDAMSKLDAAIQKYGFSIEELGPKFREQKLQEQAEGLIEDYNVLIASGIENGVVTAHMTDAVNDYIHTALKTGTEVPEAMKPMLEKMAEMGELTDDTGAQMNDLSKLTFSTTLTKGFQSVVDKLDELIRRLTGDLPRAADRAATQIVDQFGDLSFDIPVNFNVPKYPDLPPGVETLNGGGTPVYPQAAGGDYVVRKPTLFLAGEAGPERVSFSGAGRTGGTVINVNVDATGAVLPDRTSLRVFADRLVPHLTGAILRQVQR